MYKHSSTTNSVQLSRDYEAKILLSQGENNLGEMLPLNGTGDTSEELLAPEIAITDFSTYSSVTERTAAVTGSWAIR